jgi:flagellar biosynthetic protein FlhB
VSAAELPLRLPVPLRKPPCRLAGAPGLAPGGGPFDVPLQWFAAEDEGRTEEPTEHKLRKAREEGKVAKSAELASALVLLFGVAALAVVAGYFLKNTAQMLRFFFQLTANPQLGKGLVNAFFSYFLRLVAPVLAVALVAAVLGNVLQVGFLFSAKPITPDLNRILPNLGRFFRRALFSGEAAFNLAKNVVKIAVVLVIAYLNVRGELTRIVRLGDSSWQQGFRLIAVISLRIVVESAIAMLVLAIPDYLFQRRQHLESLKMSRQEVKEERRMYEGDPLVRSRLREKMRELLTRNMMKAVPRADVVITNPTHYSVAVEWNRLLMPAPTVTAKGVDAVAMKIREVAREAKVPLVENKPLARTLYHEVDIGESIPERYYEVMAVILAEVYRLAGKAAEAI